jgi:cytochrome P450
MGLVMGHSILEMDEPEHRAYRGLIQQAFTLKAMERWEQDIVAPIVHRMIDAFVERGSADLVRELAFPFPIHVIAAMLGLPKRTCRSPTAAPSNDRHRREHRARLRGVPLRCANTSWGSR